MLAIETRNLQKRYRARVKLPGLRASLKALARSEYREVDAVRGVNLAVERGETLACIGPKPVGLEELCVNTGLPTAVLLSTLMKLELSGRVFKQPGQRYVLR